MAFTAGNLSVHSKHPYRPHLGLGTSHGFETEVCFANMIGCIEAGAWRDLEIETLSSKMEALKVLKVLKVQDFGNLSCHLFLSVARFCPCTLHGRSQDRLGE